LSTEGIVEKWLYAVNCSVIGLCWWRKVQEKMSIGYGASYLLGSMRVTAASAETV
jgi:hypothetical protein